MATTAVDAIFADTNVLVYANVAESPWHQAAVATLSRHYDAGVKLWISRQVLREYLAALTRPQVFAAPQPVAIVIARVRFFETRFHIAEDGPEVTARLLALLEQIPIGGKQVHDANLVATMQVKAIRHLLTHNARDFARFAPAITVLSL